MSSFYTNVTRFGNQILFRGYKNNKYVQSKIPYHPTFYVPSKTKSDYVSLIGEEYLSPMEFDSMREASDFIKQYEDVANFKIYGHTNFVSQFIQKAYPGKISYDITKINIVSFDIEVDISNGYPNILAADKEITSISFKSSKQDTYHLYGRKPYDKSKTITGIHPNNIQYYQCESEQALLYKFIERWTYEYPDVVTGWNVEYFDIAYLCKRIENVLGEHAAKKLSPWGSIRQTQKVMFNKTNVTYEISGISVIDYMDTFKKFGYKYGPQESYKLDHISHVVLGEKKLSYEEYGSLTELYNKNPQLYLDYNLKDTYLIERLEEETKLLDLVMTIAYGGGVNYKDAFGTVGIWESTIYRKLISKNIVPHINKNRNKSYDELIGGYVKEPVPGLYEWIVSFDLNSLYPHLMLQYNMSPETIMNSREMGFTQDDIINGTFSNKEKSYSLCANGVKFSNEKLGVIPEIISDYYGNREKIKKEMLQVEQQLDGDKSNVVLKRKASQLHNQQMSIKIMMNSLYGATANKYFLYYISEMAEAITTSGQLSIRYAEKSVNEYMNKILKTDKNYVVYIDTDSIYVDMSDIVFNVFKTKNIDAKTGSGFLDKVCKTKIEETIRHGYEELAEKMGAYRNAMTMKREKITDKTIFLAKKRYIMNVLNSEGVEYEIPKLSVTGIESVRSSTPEVCRNKMSQLFKIIMTGNESDTQKFIADFKKEFVALPVEDVAKISGTDDIEKYLSNGQPTKGCPMHVRGCIVYNNYLRSLNLQNRYRSIQSGDKVKFVYLNTPNPLMQNVVSFVDVLPKEFDLDKYVDRETQFDKVFLSPIVSILDAVGWSAEHKNDIMDFFM